MGRTKKPIEGKCPFVIRRRKLKDGRVSLFIDSFEEGKHKYHFLKLYLLPGKSEKTRRENIRTLRRAEDIQREMRIELLSEDQSSKREGFSGNVSLGAFIASLAEEYKKEGKAGYRHLITAKSNLDKFRHNIIMSEIDREFLISYYNWLRNDCTTSKGRRLKEMTVYIYFRKLGVILTWAYSRGVLKENVWKRLDMRYKTTEPITEKRFLTLRELHLLDATPYEKRPLIRQAFLFSCMCGLRISDIRMLSWKEISFQNGHYFITKQMKKTGSNLSIPLPGKACEYLPPRRSGVQQIFEELPSSAQLLCHLNRWIFSAGLKGRVNFHTARHTFATLLLTTGTDLYIISRLLGHSDIRTTRRYARVVDSRKQEAISLMDNLFC